jgi:hypothetical protein
MTKRPRLQCARDKDKYVEKAEVARIVAREELSLGGVKRLIRGVRYARGFDERFEYANTLVPEAASYLRPYTLRVLVRGEISEAEAAAEIEQNKLFFSRLVDLLPSLVRFFSRDTRVRNPAGIVSTIDDCHNDFHYTIRSARKDRQLREAKERLAKASKLASETAFALGEAKRHCDIEYDRYRKAYYLPSEGPSRFFGDLIDELKVCSGALEIVNVTADIKPKRLFVFGNDQRGTVVEWAYHMATMWNGPKLVTTPGSDFAAFCSLLFEAVSGTSDEGLAGAINRYARSDNRKQWDREGNEEVRENDNFLSEKNRMTWSEQEIAVCKEVLKQAGLSDMAKLLLYMRIEHEKRAYEDARTKYGPRQVYLDQMNEDQIVNMLSDAIKKFKPEQLIELDDMMLKGKSSAAKDIEFGRNKRKTVRN